MRDYVLADVSDDAAAPASVGVPEEFRARLLARGLERVGYVGYRNLVIGYDSIVEVMRCPGDGLRTGEASSVGVLFDGGNLGPGFGLRTLLEDGTVVVSEAYEHGAAGGFRKTRVMDMHGASARFRVSGHPVAPELLFDLHAESVARAVREQNAKPVSDEPFRLYLATRLRSADLHVARARRLLHDKRAVFSALLFGVFALVEGAGILARGARVILPLLPFAATTAAVAAVLFTGRVTLLLERRSGTGGVPSPKELLERADRVPRATIAALSQRA